MSCLKGNFHEQFLGGLAGAIPPGYPAHAPTVLQRVARYADGWLPNRITPHQVEESRKRLDTLVTAQGRDPASVSISVFGQPPDTTREQVEAFLHAGAVRVAVWLADCETEHAMGEQLARMANALVR